jgi:hypothetical protein
MNLQWLLEMLEVGKGTFLPLAEGRLALKRPVSEFRDS